jgi:hypothetical protein
LNRFSLQQRTASLSAAARFDATERAATDHGTVMIVVYPDAVEGFLSVSTRRQGIVQSMRVEDRQFPNFRVGIMAWEHAVQLYLNDAFLIKSLTRFILAGLEEKATVIAVVTEKHREDLRRVSRSAHDPLSEETLVFLDACDLLSAFMIDGWPDHARFLSEIGHIVDTATRPGPVRIVQEMGTVLWAQGNTRAALRVEELWNEIAPLHAFSLVCAYPTSAYSAENDDDSFLPVCLTHTHVRTSRSLIPLAH